MSVFRRFAIFNFPSSGSGGPSFVPGLQHATRWLVTVALCLIGLGILILCFPLILAVAVAILFFLIALLCLRFALKIYLASRPRRHDSQYIDVKIINPHDEN